LMVKAAAGGGGRGMRQVSDAESLSRALNAARAEALNAFGSDELILERLVQGGRHEEIQVFADAHGNVIHLGERDCSTQRRHQKVLEEAPSPAVDAPLRETMGDAACRAARAVGYRPGMLDVSAIRAGFPALDRIVGDQPAVYADGPGGTQAHASVIEAMAGTLQRGVSNLGGPFDASREAARITNAARRAVADLFNAASPNAEAALVFLEWMTTPEFAELYSNALPGFFTLSSHDITLTDPLAQEFLSWRGECESTIRSSYQILSRGNPNNENDLWNASAQVLNGTLTPEEAASQVQQGLEAWYGPQQ